VYRPRPTAVEGKTLIRLVVEIPMLHSYQIVCRDTRQPIDWGEFDAIFRPPASAPKRCQS
jgi:hypothetical protein